MTDWRGEEGAKQAMNRIGRWKEKALALHKEIDELEDEQTKMFITGCVVGGGLVAAVLLVSGMIWT